MSSPAVYIVGAGPGDPSLITVRGLRCLEAADVVVFDHRVDARLLRRARPDAERIDVGPSAPRPLEQDAISILLAEKAREGKVVVRLKVGDPFVFDSGGKEALFLHEQGIPFEVVPGVPATTGGPAYAGVPVTYPEAGDVLTLIRGNESETDTLPHVDWERLAAMGGTIVCQAGTRQIQAITHALVSHGRDAQEAAVLIYQPTLPQQRTIEGTLGTIASLARERGQAVLVLGAVAGFRQHLRWFDARPLFGRRIVVTRSREQPGELMDMLEERGAEAIGAPTIRIAPPEDGEALDRACAEAGTYDWIIFTSASGVDYFMQRVLATGDVRDLKGVRICTTGPSTASRLQRYGIKVDLTPEEYRAEAVLAALKERGSLAGLRFLLPRADAARDLLADDLREAGAEVADVVAYRTLLASPGEESEHDVYRMLLERQVDAITFTSASTVKNFVQILGQEQAADLLRTTVVASIGPVTAEAAQHLGIETTIIPREYTIPHLVDALVEHFSRHDERASPLD